MAKFSAKYIGKDGKMHGFSFTSDHRLIWNMNLNSNPLLADMFAALRRYRENPDSMVSRQARPDHYDTVQLVGIINRETGHRVLFDLPI